MLEESAFQRYSRILNGIKSSEIVLWRSSSGWEKLMAIKRLIEKQINFSNRGESFSGSMRMEIIFYMQKGRRTTACSVGRMPTEELIEKNFFFSRTLGNIVPDVPIACAISWRRLSRPCNYTQRRAPLPIPAQKIKIIARNRLNRVAHTKGAHDQRNLIFKYQLAI